MSEKGKLTKRELISKISQHTKYRTDVVEEILDGFIDVAAEEIINKGEFGVIELFSISSAEWTKGFQISETNIVPPRPRLIIKVSARIRELWKFRHDHLQGKKGIITKDNWREATTSIRENKKRKRDKNRQN